MIGYSIPSISVILVFIFIALTSFKDDLGADSLDLFELVMALEDEYSVEIPAEDLQNLATVGDVMKYLKDKGVEE